MKSIFSALSIVCIILLCGGCSKIDSSDLNTDVPLYQAYQVTYYKANNSTSCAAHYLVRNTSGTRVELGSGSGVTMNGALPSTSLIDKTLYEWNGSGFFDATFILTKHSGKTITNIVKRNDINDINFSSLPDTVSKTAGFSFGWTGVPLNNDEKIVVQISALGSSVYSQTVSGSTIAITSGNLSDLPVGKVSVELIRVRTIPVQVTDSGASGVTSIYYNNAKDIVLVP